MMEKRKIYSCFDANTDGNRITDSDMKYYNLLKAWKENSRVEFDFVNVHDYFQIPQAVLDRDNENLIKEYLKKRLGMTEVFIVIVGEHTANLYKYVRWEIQEAIDRRIPIIAVNISGTNGVDDKYCPPILRDKLALHVPFDYEKIKYAVENWPAGDRQNRVNGINAPRIYS